MSKCVYKNKSSIMEIQNLKFLYEKSKSIINFIEFLEWNYACEEVIERLDELIADKSTQLRVGTRNSFISRRILLEGCRQQLQRRFVVSSDEGSSVRKNEEFYWFEIETAFDSRIVTGSVINIKYVDPRQFLETIRDIVLLHVQINLERFNSIKVNTTFNGEFLKDKTEVKSFNTKNCVLYVTSDLEEWYKVHVTENILAQLEEFQERDSGWALSCILNLLVNINKHNPMHAGCYTDLPLEIKNKQAIINIRSYDNTCFAHAVVAALYPVNKDCQRVNKYPDYKSVLNLEGITFPVSLKQITRFETNNNVSINVFIVENDSDKGKHEVRPIRVSKCYNKDRHVNLLYLPKENVKDVGHFALIKNLSRLVSSQINRKNHQKYICERCLCYLPTSERLDAHRVDCDELNDGCYSTVLPTEEQKFMKFKHTDIVKQRLPFVIYADLECVLEKKDEDSANAKKKSYAIQEHKVFSIGYYVHCDYNNSLFTYKSFRGRDGVNEWFVSELKNVAEYVINNEFNRNVRMEERSAREWYVIVNSATNCSICAKPFAINDIRVRDHCHFTGKFRGVAHQSCNLNYCISYVVPIVFHNLSGYDTHFIIKHIVETFEGKTEVLPLTKEKYISFTQNITFPGIKNHQVKLRFIDSFKFLSSSLDKLSSYLDISKLKIVYSHFKNIPHDKFLLLTRKGIFPYEYIDNYEKLNETSLPSIDSFYSSLSGDTISNNDYEHAKNVWQQFNINTLGEYSDLYLKLDVLLLADVFENFRRNCLQSYSLDPAYYYTLPGYTWDAMLKYTGITLELLTDVDMLYFIERGVRGGITQCSHRYARANNKYMNDSYDSTEPSIYLMYFDINNLYGWAMSQPLPYGNFQWVSDIASFDLSSVRADSDIGYILEVDISYPQHLHDSQTDFPFCPTHSKASKSGQQKLMITLYDKKRYVIHYSSLQQCVHHGLQITKIYRILQFNQSPWLKKYIDLNTSFRQLAKNDFEKNLYKLMNNAIYGKTMENVRHYVDVKFCTKWEGRYQMEAAIAKPNFHSRSIFSENFVAVQFSKLSVFFNKPIYAGMCILDISKTRLYDFHYKYMMQEYPNKCKILYMDTDSIMYKIECSDVYSDIKRNLSYFDTSDYIVNNIYGMPHVNKKVPGLMKDECNGEIMREFVGLRAKMYAFKVNNHETKKVKGVKKNVIARTITFDDYINCLNNEIEMTRQQVLIRSKLHNVFTIVEEKIALSPFDDKRHISDDCISTLPWGHYKLQQQNET